MSPINLVNCWNELVRLSVPNGNNLVDRVNQQPSHKCLIKRVNIEIYKPLIYNGEETNYLVSESGKVYNKVTDHYLTPTTDSSGRLTVCISICGRCYSERVHKLVYLAFHGEIKQNMTINHIDEDFLHNHYTNLESVTREENCRLYRINNGNPEKKYSDMKVVEICNDLKDGIYYKDVASAHAIPIQYVFSLLKGKRRKFIVDKFLPFPESAHRKREERHIPHEYIDKLIMQGYSNADILDLLEMKQNVASDKLFARSRKRLGCPAPKYFSKELLNAADCLISSGKSNVEIYEILGIEYNERNANMIARARQRIGIANFNPNGVSLDVQHEIVYDIINGLSNSDIIDKYKFERSAYITNMLGRLRQKAKKIFTKGSTTIESISI